MRKASAISIGGFAIPINSIPPQKIKPPSHSTKVLPSDAFTDSSLSMSYITSMCSSCVKFVSGTILILFLFLDVGIQQRLDVWWA